MRATRRNPGRSEGPLTALFPQRRFGAAVFLSGVGSRAPNSTHEAADQRQPLRQHVHWEYEEGDTIADAELEAEEAEAEVTDASQGEYVDEPSTTGRAAKYQEYATGRPAGQAYKLNGVKFDSFEGGNLIDAKGPGYARLFQQSFADSVKSKLSSELIRQIGARAGAKIVWRIAEEEAVPVFEELVEEAGGSGIVDVVFYPPPFPL